MIYWAKKAKRGKVLFLLVQHLGELEWQGRDVLVQELLKFTARDILLYHDDLPCSPWLVTTLAAHIMRLVIRCIRSCVNGIFLF